MSEPTRTLIVDDEELVRKMIRKALSNGDYDILEADNGKSALMTIKERQPELLVLDLRMPEMSGLALLDQLRETPPARELSIIVLTGHGDDQDIEECYKRGVNRFLHKPCSIIEVRETVKNCVEAARLRDQLRAERDLLETRVRERTEALSERNEQLRAAKVLAEQANFAKTEFLSNMSHEMITPLNAIAGFTELVLDSKIDPDQRENLRVVREKTEELLAIIRRLLFLTKLDSGKVRLHVAARDPRQCLYKAVQRVNAAARQKALALSWSVDADIPERLMLDADLLDKALTHLLSNAVKFTETGSVRVAFSALSREGAEKVPGLEVSPFDCDSIFARLTVSDTGIGVPEEAKASIFEKFTQQDTSLSRVYGGMGTGLPIVRAIVELMGGVLQLDSAPGKGSSFHIVTRFARAPEDDIE